MEKEKAEIAGLVERYGRVQSLMKYVKRFTSLSSRSFHLGFVQTEVVTMQFKE